MTKKEGGGEAYVLRNHPLTSFPIEGTCLLLRVPELIDVTQPMMKSHHWELGTQKISLGSRNVLTYRDYF